jgi:hypothetical protein
MQLVFKCIQCGKEGVGSITALPLDWAKGRYKGFDIVKCEKCRWENQT